MTIEDLIKKTARLYNLRNGRDVNEPRAVSFQHFTGRNPGCHWSASFSDYHRPDNAGYGATQTDAVLELLAKTREDVKDRLKEYEDDIQHHTKHIQKSTQARDALLADIQAEE